MIFKTLLKNYVYVYFYKLRQRKMRIVRNNWLKPDGYSDSREVFTNSFSFAFNTPVTRVRK